MKYILFTLFSLLPLCAKEDPKLTEFMAKLNKLEAIKKEIAEKEKYIDQLLNENSIVFNCLGDDQAQKELILLEGNKLEQYIVHALETNTNVEQALKEPLCPSLTIHRNELDRIQNLIVRVCMEYFLLKKLYQLYSNIAAEAVKMQPENIQ